MNEVQLVLNIGVRVEDVGVFSQFLSSILNFNKSVTDFKMRSFQRNRATYIVCNDNYNLQHFNSSIFDVELKVIQDVIKKENYRLRKKKNVSVCEAFGRLVCCNGHIRQSVIEFHKLSIDEVRIALRQDTYRCYERKEIENFFDEYGINYEKRQSIVSKMCRKLQEKLFKD